MQRQRLTQEGLKSGAQAQVTPVLLTKAAKCLKVAKVMLGKDASEGALGDQAAALMEMSDEALEMTARQVKADQNAPDAFNPGTYPDTHEKVTEVPELREPKGKKKASDGCGCDDAQPEESIMLLSDVPTDELETEIARRAAEDCVESGGMTEDDKEPMPEVDKPADDKKVVKPQEEEAEDMKANTASGQKPVAQRQAGDANDPANYAGRENEVDVPTIAEKSAKLAAILREARSYGNMGPKLASLSSKVASWAINADEANLPAAAEAAVELSKALQPAKTHSALGASLAKLAAEVADGLVSPDTGEVDQENEVNPKFKPNYEAPSSDSEKAMTSKRKAAAPVTKKAEEANPAKDVAPHDAPEERTLPKDDESTSDELPGHKAASKPASKKADDAEEKAEEAEDKAIDALETAQEAEEAEEGGEEAEEGEEVESADEDGIEPPCSSEVAIDEALAAADEEEAGDVPQGASDDDVLDVLFEEDEEKAASKLAAIKSGQNKTASKKPVAQPKVGAKKIGMGPKTASSGKSEISMLSSALWSSKPDVSKYFK